MSTESQLAFEQAIKAGVLSDDISHPHFAGNYMYMGKSAGFNGLSFKHIITRAYLHLLTEKPPQERSA